MQNKVDGEFSTALIGLADRIGTLMLDVASVEIGEPEAKPCCGQCRDFREERVAVEVHP